MYEFLLGEGYHDVIRKILNADDYLVPNSMIDADLNIGALRMLMAGQLDKLQITGNLAYSDNKSKSLYEACRYYLAGILCVAIRSRVNSSQFVKYRHRNWDKKRDKCMAKGTAHIARLMW